MHFKVFNVKNLKFCATSAKLVPASGCVAVTFKNSGENLVPTPQIQVISWEYVTYSVCIYCVTLA